MTEPKYRNTAGHPRIGALATTEPMNLRPPMNNDPWIDYLGDGVYAQFDGYAVSLMVNDHRNEPVVVLEPDVLKALNDFYARVVGHYA